MGGLAILLIVTLYVVAAIFVVRAVEGRAAKIAATLLVILIPTADAILGRIYLAYLCRAEAGLRVFRVVDGVDGVQLSTGLFADHETDEQLRNFVRSYRFRFLEGRTWRDGTVDRITLENDKVIRERKVEPKSLFRIRFLSSNYAIAFIKDQYLIDSIANGEVVATDTQYVFEGGWAEQFLASFSDAGPSGVSWCGAAYPEIRSREIIKSSLKPKTNSRRQ